MMTLFSPSLHDCCSIISDGFWLSTALSAAATLSSKEKGVGLFGVEKKEAPDYFRNKKKSGRIASVKNQRQKRSIKGDWVDMTSFISHQLKKYVMIGESSKQLRLTLNLLQGILRPRVIKQALVAGGEDTVKLNSTENISRDFLFLAASSAEKEGGSFLLALRHAFGSTSRARKKR